MLIDDYDHSSAIGEPIQHVHHVFRVISNGILAKGNVSEVWAGVDCLVKEIRFEHAIMGFAADVREPFRSNIHNIIFRFEVADENEALLIPIKANPDAVLPHPG